MSGKTTPNDTTAVAALLRAAAGRHQAGDFAAAGAQYRAVLAQAPDHPEALYLSGALAMQTGAGAEAVTKLERSLAFRPNYLPAIEALGAAFAALGDFEKSVGCFEHAAAEKADSPEAHYNLGHSLFRLGRYTKAVAAFRQAIALKPAYDDAGYLLAVALRLDQKFPAAAVAYAKLIERQPRNARALDEYGGVLVELGRIPEAEAVIRRAIAAAPNMANPYTNLGRLYNTDVARAADCLALHDQALARNPNYAEAHNNRGVALYTLSRFDEAVASFGTAIALKPALAEAYNNLGNAKIKIGDAAAAVSQYQEAIARNPDYAEAHWNKALALLTLGDLAAGWSEYDWRWQCRDFTFPPRGFTQPRWQGGALGDGTLLVWGEQGVGDEVLYASMVGDLVERGVALLWESDPRLVPLLRRSYPGVVAIGRTTPPDPATAEAQVSAQISTASLGQYLRRDAGAFPARRNYLKADETRAGAYRARALGADKTRLIGVSWISKNPDFGVHKTSRLEDWAPIWRAGGAASRFIDLQYGDTAAERTAAGLDLAHLDDLDLFNDLDGLAALIAACDLVITVSNTTAHLAGALGVPVWVMVPSGNGKLWYWGAETAGSLWYPSASVFKHSSINAWDEVIDRVAQKLETTK